MSNTVIFMQFTVDSEPNGRLSFLDCNVHRVNGKLLTSVYRKCTFSGLGGSILSFCSFSFIMYS